MTRVHAAQGANISSAVEKDYKKYNILYIKEVIKWLNWITLKCSLTVTEEPLLEVGDSL